MPPARAASFPDEVLIKSTEGMAPTPPILNLFLTVAAIASLAFKFLNASGAKDAIVLKYNFLFGAWDSEFNLPLDI
jgi:hypothetical protein